MTWINWNKRFFKCADNAAVVVSSCNLHWTQCAALQLCCQWFPSDLTRVEVSKVPGEGCHTALMGHSATCHSHCSSPCCCPSSERTEEHVSFTAPKLLTHSVRIACFTKSKNCGAKGYESYQNHRIDQCWNEWKILHVSRLKSNLLKHAPGGRIIFLVVFFLLFFVIVDCWNWLFI